MVTRRHGWSGDPPADEDEARKRIVDATIRLLDRSGAAQVRLADVATELGVTRQTVYRYFPGMDELLAAVTDVTHESFVDALSALFERVSEPIEFVVEAMAYVIERLPDEPHVGLLLVAGHTARFERGAMRTEVIGRVVDILRNRMGVDWSALGYDDASLAELVEVMVRMIQSMVVAPPEQPRSGPELRAFLRRWIGPAVIPPSP